MVDHNGLFRDLCIGWPGSIHDACVFANFAPFNKVTNGELLQGQELPVRGGTIPVFLVGDSAYSLLSWLIKPFSFSSSLSQQQLNKKIDVHVNNVPNVNLESCILHNICKIHGDEFNEECLEDSDLVQTDDTHVLTTTQDGGTVRDLLVNYFEHH